MDFYGDYHTHTTFSHGKATIAQNAQEAAAKGFREIAITDHGFRHVTYNVTRRSVPRMQRQIAEAAKQCGVDVLFGMETNITGRGRIDLKPSDMEFLDIVLCGYHKFVVPLKPRDFFHFARVALLNPKRLIARNTDLYLSVIEKYDIDVITHINYSMFVDCEKVAKACAQTGTMIELNGKRINFSDDEFRAMAAAGAQFIVNSDAHRQGKIGDFTAPLELLKRVPIPETQIANLGKRPVFRSQKK